VAGVAPPGYTPPRPPLPAAAFQGLLMATQS
jgi:hypothetical protein